MARDIDKLERYVENVPYGEDSLPSEIHGPENEEIIRIRVKSLVDANNLATKVGNSDIAAKTEKLIRHTYKECSNGEVLKQDWAASLRSQSNWGDMTFLDKAMTENCIVGFNEEGKMLFTVQDEMTGVMITQTIEAASTEFHEIGDWMQPLMKAKQELIKARNDRGNPPPFDISYFVNNLIKNNWKSMIADSDPTLDPNGLSKGYRLQLILQDAMDESGNLPPDYNLDKESFNPENDTR